jgi:hypothetical protein
MLGLGIVKKEGETLTIADEKIVKIAEEGGDPV